MTNYSNIPTEEIISKYENQLDKNSIEFFRRVFSKSTEIYNKRLKLIKFENFESVLDAGCGFGQWTIELAKMNMSVYALDVSAGRINVLNEIAKSQDIDNIEAKQGNLEKLPYADDSFDAIFCYGAVFLAKWRHCLKEFLRVLKKRGTIYLNANSLGWYLNLWKNHPNKADNYDPKEWAAKAFMNTYNYEKGKDFFPIGGIIIEKEEMIEELKKKGFEIIAEGNEGTINLTETDTDIPQFFKGEYEGHCGVFEIIAKLEVR